MKPAKKQRKNEPKNETKTLDTSEPVLISLTKGLSNEDFGDIAMVVEFFNAFSPYVTHEKLTLTTKSLVTILTGGEKYIYLYGSLFRYMMEDIVQTNPLLKKETDIGVKVATIQINEWTAPDVARFYLDLVSEDEICEDVCSAMSRKRLSGLSPKEKLQFLTCVIDLYFESSLAGDKITETQEKAKVLCRQYQNMSDKDKENVENTSSSLNQKHLGKGVLPPSNVEKPPTPSKKISCLRNGRERLETAAKIREELEKQRVDAAVKLEKLKKDYDLYEELKTAVLGRHPVGKDRYGNLYWRFSRHIPGLYLEKRENLRAGEESAWYRYKSLKQILQLQGRLSLFQKDEKALKEALSSEIEEFKRNKAFPEADIEAKEDKAFLVDALVAIQDIAVRARHSKFMQHFDLSLLQKSAERATSVGQLAEVLAQFQVQLPVSCFVASDDIEKNRKDMDENLRSCTCICRLHYLLEILSCSINWNHKRKLNEAADNQDKKRKRSSYMDEFPVPKSSYKNLLHGSP